MSKTGQIHLIKFSARIGPVKICWLAMLFVLYPRSILLKKYNRISEVYLASDLPSSQPMFNFRKMNSTRTNLWKSTWLLTTQSVERTSKRLKLNCFESTASQPTANSYMAQKINKLRRVAVKNTLSKDGIKGVQAKPNDHLIYKHKYQRVISDSPCVIRSLILTLMIADWRKHLHAVCKVNCLMCSMSSDVS